MLRVKDAPDMGLMETVIHFTSLLYNPSLLYNAYDADRRGSPSIIKSKKKKSKKKSLARVSPLIIISNASSAISANSKNSDVSPLGPISKIDSLRVIKKAKRCLQWAQDAGRPPVPGAQKMSADQV